ncbi:MAG TPA: M90 family metallopeptidase [Rhodanobacteraceae bacterium]
MIDWLPPRRPPPPIDEVLWQAALADCPLARRLDRPRQMRLRLYAARFLKQKRFHPVDMQLGIRERLLIAMQACIPVLELGWKSLRDWQTVIVYPHHFRVHHDHHDRATGVVTQTDQIRAGEAWQRGPLVLSWQAVRDNLDNPWAGHNVVAHEIAHKLDMLDGTVDGLPILPKGLSRETWVDTFQQAYDGLHATLDAGLETAIDPYAATNPGEYFAVVSELHFSDPHLLAQVEPAVAAQLHAFYGPSPAP